MFNLWLITGILGYASKIPIIGRIISLLTIWYGRTTWWKILVKLRKVFITFNAIIGVFVVFKTTGFTPDLLLNNIVMMGHTYFEIFTNLTKRLFTWFFDLFDHKIVPNVPGDKPSINKSDSSGVWTPRGIDYGINNRLPKFDSIPNKDSLRETYANLFNITVDPTPISWYKDYTTWLWIGGILCTIGGLYFGYKFIIDPLFIDNINNSGTSTVKPSPTSPTDPSGGASGGDASNPILNGIFNVTRYVNNGIKKLNPMYWFMSSSDTSSQIQAFIDNQNSIHRSDMRFYPFTNINPYDSWITRMRIHWLGETTFELTNRMNARQIALSGIDNILNYNKNTESPLLGSGTLTPLYGIKSGFSTPRIGTVGLTPSYRSGAGFLELIEQSSSFQNTFDKLASLPSTPTVNPTTLPETDITELKGVNPSWMG